MKHHHLLFLGGDGDFVFLLGVTVSFDWTPRNYYGTKLDLGSSVENRKRKLVAYQLSHQTLLDLVVFGITSRSIH